METGEIDAFIHDQEELIGLLQERRSAVLSRATLGRSDYVVQGHLGYFLRKLDRQAISGLGVVTAFRDGTVTSRSNRREQGFTFSDLEAGYQGVLEGDLVFHGLDGFSGAAGVSDSAGNCSPVYHVCYPSESVDAAYAALYLRALGTSGFLTAYAWSVRQRSVDYRNWQVFSRLPVEFPAVSAQLETVMKVREHLSEIDAAIADARAAMDLSAERRSALISAAVTGKIDVLERAGV
jgi:type I restriction enzyme S subunit